MSKAKCQIMKCTTTQFACRAHLIGFLLVTESVLIYISAPKRFHKWLPPLNLVKRWFILNSRVSFVAICFSAFVIISVNWKHKTCRFVSYHTRGYSLNPHFVVVQFCYHRTGQGGFHSVILRNHFKSMIYNGRGVVPIPNSGLYKGALPERDTLFRAVDICDRVGIWSIRNGREYCHFKVYCLSNILNRLTERSVHLSILRGDSG